VGRKAQRQKTTLFKRILLRLTLPLFLLAAFVTAGQLINQIQSMSRLYQLESRLIFESAHKLLDRALESEQNLQHPEQLKEMIQKVIPLQRDVETQIFDLFNKSAFFSDGTPWNRTDQLSAENSIHRKKEEGKTFTIRVDKENKKLIAYMPFEKLEQNHLFVARIAYPLPHIADALRDSRGMLFTTVLLILLAGVLIGRGLAKSIINPIRELNGASKAIMDGQLGEKVVIKTGDEIETLAKTFNHMSDSLKTMKANAEDSNPLTQLPGNRGIETELKKRIREKQKFVLFHTDLDRFKTFNDLYGLAKGDLAIIKTANLLREVIQQNGTRDDFVGHQGGDDYVVIVKPNHAKEIAEAIIKRFDTEIVKSLHPKEDYERGYTIGLDRRGMSESGKKEAIQIKFPLIALSLAGVSNVKRDFGSYDSVLKVAAKIKKKVKAIVESSYLIEE